MSNAELVLMNPSAPYGQPSPGFAREEGYRSDLMQHGRTRIALLGAGAMARAHAAAYATLAAVELIEVPARDDARVRRMFEDRDVDAIDICLPSAVHARFAIPALEHGKHVFCETPMALDLDEARAMRDAPARPAACCRSAC
jgi:shikimate 5-dehydrogenase